MKAVLQKPFLNTRNVLALLNDDLSTTVICLIFFYMKDLSLCSLKMIDCLSKVRSCFNMERSSFICAYFYYAAKLTLVIDRQVKFSMKVLCTKTILHIDLFHFHFKLADINSNKMEVAFVNCFQFYRQSGLVPSKFKHLIGEHEISNTNHILS